MQAEPDLYCTATKPTEQLSPRCDLLLKLLEQFRAVGELACDPIAAPDLVSAVAPNAPCAETPGHTSPRPGTLSGDGDAWRNASTVAAINSDEVDWRSIIETLKLTFGPM